MCSITCTNPCSNDKKDWYVDHYLHSLLIVNYNPLMRFVHLTLEHLPYKETKSIIGMPK